MNLYRFIIYTPKYRTRAVHMVLAADAEQAHRRHAKRMLPGDLIVSCTEVAR